MYQINITCVVTPNIQCPNHNRYVQCTENKNGPFLCCGNCQKLLAKPSQKGSLSAETKCTRCKTINERHQI